TEALPPQRVVLEFAFSGAPDDCQKFWLVCQREGVEMCLKDPDLDVDLLITADLRLFVESWRGFRDLRGEIERGRIRVLGADDLVRRFPDWLLLSSLAPTERRREGAERRLSQRSRGPV
ncbi:MAG: hypothetical protein K8J08_18850, partial [Thermoanaerobaculia bacterium]|nr:hypothetical protein [Thermoanaerobaculia bacterium]